MAGKIITDFIKMQLFKKGGAIASDKAVKFSADALEKRLKNLGIDPNTLNSQTELKQLLAYVKQAEDQAFNQMYSGILSGDEAAKFLNKAFPKKGEVVKFPQKRSFAEEIEAMKKSGDIVDEDNMVISEKITDREMFKDASKRFNQTDMVADSVARITSMEPVAALKEANKIIKREGIYKNLNKDQSQAILKSTDDWIHQRDLADRWDYKKNRPFRDDPDFDPDDPDYLQRMRDEDAPDFAKGGRAGFYNGGYGKDAANYIKEIETDMHKGYQYYKKHGGKKSFREYMRESMSKYFAGGGRARYYTGGITDVKPSLDDIGHGSDSLMARTRLMSPGSQATTSTGLNYLLAEDNDNIRVPFQDGLSANKIDLGKIMQNVIGERDPSQLKSGKTGRPGRMMGQAARESKSMIDKYIAKFTHAVDKLDQEERSLAISAFNDQLKLGYSTTISGVKMDAFDKLGIVPIDKETIYSAIVNMDLPRELKLKMSAIGDAAGSEELAFSLANNNLGITYDNKSQEIIGKFQLDSKDGSLSIKPVIKKDADSKITRSIEIDKAIDGGKLDLDITDTGNNSLFKFEGKKDGALLNLEKSIGDENYLKGKFRTDLPLYKIEDDSFFINDEGKAEKNYLEPTFVAKYNPDDFTNYGMGFSLPLTPNIAADLYSTKYKDDTSAEKLGLFYNKALANDGILQFGGEVDSDSGKNFMLKFNMPIGYGNIDRSEPENLLIPYHERKALEQKKLEEEYLNNIIYRGDNFDELKESVSDFDLKDLKPTKQLPKYLTEELASGGRIGFAGGGDAGRRAFLKLLATLGGGIAGLKSGLFGMGGKEATKKAVTETVKQSAGLGQPPPYFFRLVEKIRAMGDDTLPSQDKVIAKKYKDYVMEEDFAGNIEIIKKSTDDMYPEDVYIKYTADDTALKNKEGFVKSSEYEEFTARPDMDGKMKDIQQGVPDEVIEEAGDTTAMTLKKAEGGRIGFRVGGSGKKFLEKIFGKTNFNEMATRDPEMYKGMLEVVEMFRSRDKEGLKMYLQKFLPHMDDEMIEDFIIGGGGTEGIQGQLIRLGSGRDYAGKIEMMKKADNMRKLENLDVTEEMIRKPNASGGIQNMLGE